MDHSIYRYSLVPILVGEVDMLTHVSVRLCNILYCTMCTYIRREEKIKIKIKKLRYENFMKKNEQ
jgi:hypothetical protein